MHRAAELVKRRLRDRGWPSLATEAGENADGHLSFSLFFRDDVTIASAAAHMQ